MDGHTQDTHTHTQERLDRQCVWVYQRKFAAVYLPLISEILFPPCVCIVLILSRIFLHISVSAWFQSNTKIGMQSLLRSWKKTRQWIPNTGTKHREESSTTWEII
jgi:hypothetical protein